MLFLLSRIRQIVLLTGIILISGRALANDAGTDALNQLEKLQQAFTPLVGKTWHATGEWSNGTIFQQEVQFNWDLEQRAIVAQAHGFIDDEQAQWGQRNHGVRYFDQETQTLRFVELDIFGGMTTGSIAIAKNNIYYHYNYEGTQLVDAWEVIDEQTYRFTVGTRNEDHSWNTIFLETVFVQQANNEVIMPTDMSLLYRQIPDYPARYTAGTVAARMVDGLGFRYYWATEGLRQVDLAYRVTPESRTSAETLDHIYGLAQMVHNAVMEKPNLRPAEVEELTYAEKRMRTLLLLKTASDQLKLSTAEDLERYEVVFQRGDQRSASPFWNNLNGPLADALWHVGQVVAFRRASGNPFNSKVSVFSGQLRE